MPKAFHNTNLHYFVLNNSSWKWPFKNHSLPKISTSNNTDERKDMWNVIVLHMIIFIWTFYSISFWTIYSFLYCLYMHSNSVYYKHSTQNYDIVQSWQSILYVYAFYLQKKHKKKKKNKRLTIEFNKTFELYNRFIVYSVCYVIRSNFRHKLVLTLLLYEGSIFVYILLLEILKD